MRRGHGAAWKPLAAWRNTDGLRGASAGGGRPPRRRRSRALAMPPVLGALQHVVTTSLATWRLAVSPAAAVQFFVSGCQCRSSRIARPPSRTLCTRVASFFPCVSRAVLVQAPSPRPCCRARLASLPSQKSFLKPPKMVHRCTLLRRTCANPGPQSTGVTPGLPIAEQAQSSRLHVPLPRIAKARAQLRLQSAASPTPLQTCLGRALTPAACAVRRSLISSDRAPRWRRLCAAL